MPSTSPSASPSDAVDPSGGAGSSGNTGSGDGGVRFDPLEPLPGGNAGPNGQPTLVRPRPGLGAIHDVGAQRLIVATNGRDVAVQIEWYSGVEPCYALAGVDVTRQGSTINLVVREGTADPNAVCIELAMLKATIVDLGELEPGTYTIHAMGDAPDVTVTVK